MVLLVFLLGYNIKVFTCEFQAATSVVVPAALVLRNGS